MSGKSSAESARSSSDESWALIEFQSFVLAMSYFRAMEKYMQEMEKYLIKTECVRSGFCEETGLELYLKKEYCQITKSCHARSALCTLLSLTTEQKQCGVITALQEDVLPLCHFGNVLNIPVEIVLPETTLSSKINELKKYKATLTIKGDDLDKAETIASELATEKNMYCIKRNDTTRYLGYGTIGIEIIEQVPSVDVIVVPKYEPIYSSIIAVVKMLKPSVVVIIASYKQFLGSSAETSLTSPTSDSVSCQKLSPPNILKSSTVSSLDRSVSFSPLNLFEPTSSMSIEITVSEKKLSSETRSTDNYNVTRVILNEEEVDTAILKLSEKEQCTLDRFGVVSFAACLRACTAGSLFDAYKNKSVVALLANSADNQIDFVRLE